VRILVNVDTFAPLGGVELSTLQVCRELAARGHEIDVLYKDSGGLRDQWESFARHLEQVRGFTVPAARPWQATVLPRSVRAGVRTAPDIVYLNRSEQLLWGAATSAFAGAPLVCHLRHHPFSAPAVRVLKNAARRYIAVSEFIRSEWIEAGISPDRIEVIHNGVDPSAYPCATPEDRWRLRAALGIAPESRVFLHYGRLTSDKGAAALLGAWARAQVPEHWRLVLAGDADPDISAMIGDLRRSDVIVLPRREQVTELLAIADVTVLPALWHEPFGRVVIESMAAGVPVIASERGGIPEILAGPWARFLVDPDEVGSLEAAILRFGDWRAGEPDLGESCRSHVRDEFSLSKTVDGIESVLRFARGSPPGVSRLRPEDREQIK
jgi:glycosyltransferase involved in cell wall biosynthesis